ncbi:MAG: flagellar protein FlgN [Halanaerobiales bacterium]
MSENIEKLFEILKKEYELYTKLKETANKKNTAIIDNEIDDLAKAVERENEIIDNLEELEEIREDILSILEDKYDLAQNFQFSNLINNFPEELQEEYLELRNSLLEVIDEIHEKNQENALLLDEAIKLNNFSLKMLTKAVSPENSTYNKDKLKNKVKQGYNIIDRKA